MDFPDASNHSNSEVNESATSSTEQSVVPSVDEEGQLNSPSDDDKLLAEDDLGRSDVSSINEDEGIIEDPTSTDQQSVEDYSGSSVCGNKPSTASVLHTSFNSSHNECSASSEVSPASNNSINAISVGCKNFYK